MALPKIIKAGGGERGQFILREFNDNTVRFVLNYPGIVDVDILRRAVRAVVESVDVLHGTFFTEGISAHWKLNENMDESNFFLHVETEGDPAVTANSLSLLPVYSEDKVQIHCTLVQSKNASSLVVRMSHLVVDGGDGKYLLGKLVEAYNMISRTGNADALEIKNGSRAPEKVYDKVSREDMKKLQKSSPSSSDVRSFYPYPTKEDGRNRLVLAKIPADVMNAARKKAKTVGASVNDMMIAATYHAYAKMDGVDPAAAMCMNATMDLRRNCVDGESEGLCNMSGSFMTLLENGVQQPFGDTLATAAEQTTKIKENPLAGLEGMPIVHALARNMPICLLLEIMGKVYGTAPVGVTNLGNLKCADFALGGIVPNGGIFGGPLKKKPGMQISIISFDGECVLAVAVQCTDADVVVLQKTLDDMVAEITAYAAN